MATRKRGASSRARGRGKVGEVMHEFKHGELETRGGRKVTSRKQAVAIALNEAREAGEKIPSPRRKATRKGAAKKKTAAKKSTAKKSTAKRASTKKAARKTARRS
jgi:topoisomerase IA-like protein